MSPLPHLERAAWTDNQAQQGCAKTGQVCSCKEKTPHSPAGARPAVRSLGNLSQPPTHLLTVPLMVLREVGLVPRPTVNTH